MRQLHQLSTSQGCSVARILIAFFFLVAAHQAVHAQTLTRGPYLQTGTANGVVVRWRTSGATNSRVRYGTTPANLNSVVDHAASTTEHVITLSGLSPNTTYYYSVGTTTVTLAGGDVNHFFITAPAAGTSKPTRIWVLGDSGTANANAIAVRNAYTNFTAGRHTDLWLMLGDNAYNDGTDSEYQTAVFNMYPTMLRKSVLWPTLGNHDGRSADSGTQTGVYYDIFTLPDQAQAGGLASGTEAYYAFDYGNIHFVCLDSFDTNRAVNGAMLTWLESDLAANNKDWIIAFWHHPPYTKGSHNSDTETELIQMRQNALPILENHGVDLVLTGHSHSYERSFLIDGHYGSSGTFTNAMKRNGGSGRPEGDGAYTKPTLGPGPREGAVYAVAGSSGQISGGSLNHPAMFISLNNLGSMVLDFDGDRLDAKFLRENGVVADSFTIIKGNIPPTASITSPTNGATYTEPATINITANAADADGIVSKVDFFQGTTLLGTDTTSPYEFLWTNVAAGSYALTAKATDNRSAITTSAVVNVTVTAPGYTVTASPSTVNPGQTITASWTAPAGRPATDWIGLYAVGQPDTSYISWQYTGGASSGSLPFTGPAQVGQYEFRYFTNDTFNRVATSNTVTVTGGGGGFTLNASPSSVSPGQTINVSWTAPAGRPANDWIGMYRVGDPDSGYLSYQYTAGASSGSLPFTGPAQAGQYDFRYFTNDTFNRVATSNTVTVTGGGGGFTLNASPSSVSPGQTINVSWTAPAGRPANDWIGMYRVGDPDSGYRSYQYTAGASSGSLPFTAPAQAGQYDFRYFTNDTFNKVATSNTVTVSGGAALTLNASPSTVDNGTVTASASSSSTLYQR